VSERSKGGVGRPGALAGTGSVPHLSVLRKSIYALGDFSSNTVLGTLTLVFATYFLIHVAELRPALAGLVPLVGRLVDAVTDPLMGRISDLTRWRAGRRRPYILIGLIPLGASFALLWSVPPVGGEFVRFAYYTAVYCALTVSLTILSVPYLALQPEMALDYDDRTSLNTFRNAGSVIGILAALTMRPLAHWFGGGASGFAAAGAAMAVGVTLPWLAVFVATFERPGFASQGTETGMLEGLREVAGRRSFRQLIALYLAAIVSAADRPVFGGAGSDRSDGRNARPLLYYLDRKVRRFRDHDGHLHARRVGLFARMAEGGRPRGQIPALHGGGAVVGRRVGGAAGGTARLASLDDVRHRPGDRGRFRRCRSDALVDAGGGDR